MPIKRLAFYSGLLLLAVFAVGVTLAHNSGCDECCSTGNCGDCQDCHCASTTCFVLLTFTSSEFYVEIDERNSSPSHLVPDRDWFSDIDRPPRRLYI